MSIPKLLRRNLSSATAHRATAPEVTGPRRPDRRPPPTKRILFASAHSVVDFSNGASVATLDVLEGLAAAALIVRRSAGQARLSKRGPHRRRRRRDGRAASASDVGLRARRARPLVHTTPARADHAHPPGINPNRPSATR